MTLGLIPPLDTYFNIIIVLTVIAVVAPKTITLLLLLIGVLWLYFVLTPAYNAGTVSQATMLAMSITMLMPALIYLSRAVVELNGRPHMLKQVAAAITPGTGPAPQPGNTPGNTGTWIRDFISPVSGIDNDDDPNDPGGGPPEQPPHDNEHTLFPDADDFTHDEDELPDLDDDVDAIDDFRI